MSKGAASDASVESVREYKVWSKLEERTLVNCMLELSEKRVVGKGNFKLTGLKELEPMMYTRLENCTLLAVPHIKSKVRYFKDKFTTTLELKEASGFGWDDANERVIADDDVFSGWVKSHPKASGLNNKPLPFFEELSKVFSVNHAHGLDAVQATDATTVLEPIVHATEFVGDYTPPTVESYTFPHNLDQEQVMEELINQGLDLQATGLKHVEAGIAAAAAKGKVNGH
ncbi:hypothetical protein LINPERPRIM_LOCUS4176 [Linum perenne]